jgi:hypothetical protein
LPKRLLIILPVMLPGLSIPETRQLVQNPNDFLSSWPTIELPRDSDVHVQFTMRAQTVLMRWAASDRNWKGRAYSCPHRRANLLRVEGFGDPQSLSL